MRYNPCGRAVDITRRAYSMPCRFFNNSGVVSEVRWQECAEDAETIPFESIILSTQQEPDFDYVIPDVGEVSDLERITTLAHVPRGLANDHVCGTEEEFRNGGTRDPSIPPVRYGATGWPLCCHPPKRVRGGGAGSGRAVVVVNRGLIPRGGGAGSGRAAYAVVVSDCPDPTSTCAAAAPGSLDHLCNIVMPSLSTLWRRWSVIASHDYEFAIVGLSYSGMTWTLYVGTDCGSLTQIAEGFSVSGNATVDFTATAPNVWCRFINGGALTRNAQVQVSND